MRMLHPVPALLSATLVVTVALVAPLRARADREAPVCAPVDTIDRFRLLRQISLDLLGRIPTEAEYAAVADADDVDGAIVDAMMESEDFYSRLRTYHRSLLWGSLADVPSIVSPSHRLDLRRIGRYQVYYSVQHARVYRGDTVSCVDVQHDRFDAAGHALPLVTGYHAGTVRGAAAPLLAERCTDGVGCKIDGWVMVRPYWDPSAQVRVCAFDAQAVATGLRGTCTQSTLNDPGCGCGPGLRWCLTATGTERAVRDALVEEPLRIFEDVVRSGGDYFDALTTRISMVNGPAAHYYRNTTTGITFEAAMGTVPEVAWSDTRWRRVTRGTQHSGALTTLGFLMRFASHRGRANRYYTAFECAPFESSAEGLPPATDPCSSDPNLSTRCGCATCHERLEPAAAHWGRWRSQGTHGFLSTTELPLERPLCETCTDTACMRFCDLHYVTSRNATNTAELRMWGGTLQVAAWRTPAEVTAIGRGPRALVERAGNEPVLARCAARNVAEHLLGRPLSVEESTDWLPGLTADFTESGHDFRALMRAVVEDAHYRSIR